MGEHTCNYGRGHQAATNRGEWKWERKTCRLVIIESGLEAAKVEERECTEK
jgi:hypothetical protein